GSLLGAIAGILLAVVAVELGKAVDFLPALDYSFADPSVLLPIVAVVLTTWLASWVGSRRVLTVSPMQATGNAVESGFEELAAHGGRRAVAITLFAIGLAFLVLG